MVNKYIKFHFKRHLEDNGGEIIDFIVIQYSDKISTSGNKIIITDNESGNKLVFFLNNMLYYELYEK